jgi:hypothetical protein
VIAFDESNLLLDVSPRLENSGAIFFQMFWDSQDGARRREGMEKGIRRDKRQINRQQ